jgi:glucan-binding YG repeat protein
MGTTEENVTQEVAVEEVVQPPTSELTEPVQENESQQTQVEPHEAEAKNKEYNFKQLREKTRQVEEERDFYRRQVEQLSSPAEQEKEEEIGVGDEDLIEGRHYKALQSEVKKLKKHVQQKELETIPERLKNRFSDFDAVVTKENVEKLKDLEPELYKTITRGDDLFEKGVAAYKTLKGLGYYEDSNEISQRKEIVKNNHSKPMSVQAVKGQGALHQANIFAQGLTPDLKKQLQKEMEDARKAL